MRTSLQRAGSLATDGRRRAGGIGASTPQRFETRSRTMESLTSGTLAGTGSFRCEQCGYVVTLAAADALPDCPGCAGRDFTRASLFGAPRFTRELEPQRDPEEEAARLAEARAEITEPGAVPRLRGRRRHARSSRSRGSGRGSVAASPPTSASTTRRCRAATPSSCARPTASASSTTVASTACSSTASASSGARSRDGDEILVGRYRLSYLDVDAAVPAADDRPKATPA